MPIDAIIFGGRTRDREPLIRAITDLAEGVYDGLTLGAEATSAAEGKEGVLRYDPMSNRPFMAYGEGDYAQHYLDVVGAAKDQPIFAHVNWFQRDAEDGHFLWPGYRDNLRPLLWLLQLKNGEVKGRQTSVGIIPTEEELNLEGMDIPPEDLERILTIDKPRWQQEMGFREEHLAAVRPDARGDLGGPPPGGRRPRRRGLSVGEPAVRPVRECRTRGARSRSHICDRSNMWPAFTSASVPEQVADNEAARTATNAEGTGMTAPSTPRRPRSRDDPADHPRGHPRLGHRGRRAHPARPHPLVHRLRRGVGRS